MEEKSPLLPDGKTDYFRTEAWGSPTPRQPGVNWDESKGAESHAHDEVDSDQKKTLPEVKVYTRRLYILLLFSLLTFSQGMVWNTWGPISQSSKRVFGWTDEDIALLANWGPIAFVICLVPFCWMMHVKGLRWSCLSCSFVIALGTVFRCISSHQPAVTWLIHTGQFLNGLGGPVAMACCTIVSSTWFPPSQRTTSTSVGNLVNAMGVAMAFIIGPQLVPQDTSDCGSPLNSTRRVVNSSDHPTRCVNGSNSTVSVEAQRDGIMLLQYIECGLCVFIFVCILLYFPNKPPLPPSNTASIERINFKAGVIALLKHKQFWIISSVYGICSGVMNCWMSVLDVDLNPLGISQTTAGWMGFYSILGGTVGGLIIARLSDTFAKHMKLILVIIYCLAGAVLLWLALVAARIIQADQVYVWVTVIAGNSLITSSVPLLYELACEVTYPISEAVTTSALALYNNIGGLVFLLVMMVPNIGVSWTNWCVLGTVVICVPLLIMVRDKYNRLDLDIEVDPPQKPPLPAGDLPPPPIVTGSVNYSGDPQAQGIHT